jgi:phosphate transport system protein
MTKRLQIEIEKLKKQILSLGARVEDNLRNAIRSVENRDAERGGEIVDSDEDIDGMEVELEEECLKVLALHQPVAIDLRFIVAVLKINNDLERIGDLAVNIAGHARYFSALKTDVEIPFDFTTMVGKTKEMVKKGLDALVQLNTRMAQEVIALDAEVDTIYRAMYQKIQKAICENPENTETLIRYMGIARHLERIADHATNIAEDVIYLTEGEIIRHRAKEYEPRRGSKPEDGPSS